MRASALVLAILLSAAPALGQVQKVQGVAGGYPVPVSVSGGSFPVPTGGATSAKQDTGNASLASIDGKLTTTNSSLSTLATQTTAASIDATVTLINAALAKLTISQGAALGTNTVAMSGCSVTTAAPSYTTGTIQPCSLDTSGQLRVTASSLPLPTGAANAVAQGSTTSGQTGELMQGAVTTNAPTYTNGQTSPINMGTSGGLRTQQIGDSFTWITTAGSYGIRTGAGILRRVIVGSPVAGWINCYDNTAGSGTVIVSLTTTTSTPFNYVEVGAAFSTGLYCVTSGTGASFTVVYAPAT